MRPRLRIPVLVSLLVFSTAATAQFPGKFSVYGSGCVGSGTGPGACVALNGSGGTNTSTALKNEYAFGFTATTDLTVVGLEFYTQAFGTVDVDVPVALHRAEASRTVPLLVAAIQSTMPVSTALRFHRVTFASVVSVAKGENFWAVQGDTQSVRAPAVTSGASPIVPTFWRRAGAGTAQWTASSVIRFPAVRVLCAGGGSAGATPLLVHDGVPTLGATMQLQVLHAPAVQPATMIYGFSDSSWGGLTLPFDLGVIGGTGCSLLAAADVQVAMGLTDSVGSVKQALSVPNDFAVFDLKFYVQAFVVDPKVPRGLKVTFTRAGVGQVGN